jgi:acyl carrier protein
MSDLKEKIFQIIAQEKNISTESLSFATTIDQLTNGDELDRSDLLMSLEDGLDFEFDADDAASAKTIEDIFNILNRVLSDS